MSQFQITVTGCDDSTVVVLDLNDDEAAVVQRLAEAVTEASEYSCMPMIKVHPVREAAERAS